MRTDESIVTTSNIPTNRDGFDPSGSTVGSGKAGSTGADFAQHSQARPLVWPYRVYVVHSFMNGVTDWQFTSGSSPPRVATTQ